MTCALIITLFERALPLARRGSSVMYQIDGSCMSSPTVRMKDGTKIKGFITQAGADDFSVRDGKTGDPRIILYRDVAKVEDNRGHSILRNVLLGVGIGAGAAIAFIAIVFAGGLDV